MFWLLGLLIFACDRGWWRVEGVAIRISWVAVLVLGRDRGCVYVVFVSIVLFVWLFMVLGDVLLCCEVVCKCGWKMVS